MPSTAEENRLLAFRREEAPRRDGNPPILEELSHLSLTESCMKAIRRVLERDADVLFPGKEGRDAKERMDRRASDNGICTRISTAR